MPAQQDFLQACQQGNLERVNALIAQYDISGSSWLARMGLVALGQDYLDVAHNHNEALQQAALNDHLDIVNRLLDIPTVRDNAAADNNMALRWAARYHTEIVSRLLDIPAVRDNAAANNNETLRWAAQNGHLAIVNRLLEIPAVRDNAAANNNHALRYAAANGHLAIVNRLLEIPAVLNNAAADNNKALRWAAQYGHLAIVNCLLDMPAVRDNAAADNNNLALLWAARGDHLAMMNRLLDIPAVWDNAAADDNNALLLASRNGHLAIVNRLLQIPAVVQAINTRAGLYGNYTVIVEAFENGHHDVVAALQARGATLPEHLRERAAARPGRAAAVINGKQSVHVVSVHVSVSGSATNLVRFYPDIENPETLQEQIAGLQAWLNTEQAKARLPHDPISKQINPAITCVERLSKLDFTDQRSKVSMQQALALVWVGINNLKANGAQAAPLTESEMKNRRESFISCLYEIQRGYNFADNDSAAPVDLGGADRPICIPGAFNKLIALLAQVGHEGVNLSFVTAETLLLKAQSLPKQIFLGLSLAKQAYYAKNWEAAPALSAAEESPSDKIQTEFFEACKPLMRNLLKAEFDAFSASIQNYDQVIQDAMNNLEYVDMTEVMTEERDRIAAAAVAAEPVAVTFSSGAPTGAKRKPADKSGDEPDAKKTKP